jgi:hypothetical protein
MTYRCATRGLDHMGIPTDDAHIYCDDCGTKLYVLKPGSHAPPAWLLNGKAPRGWLFVPVPNEPGLRHDYCPKCIDKHENGGKKR